MLLHAKSKPVLGRSCYYFAEGATYRKTLQQPLKFVSFLFTLVSSADPHLVIPGPHSSLYNI